MFGSLKKKFSAAIQEGMVISESLQQQYQKRVSAATTPTTAPNLLNESFFASRGSSLSLNSQLTDGVPTHLNMAAGCNLLAKYEGDWEQIHAANEDNAARSAAVATQIASVEAKASAQRITITDLNTCLAGIPKLVEKLKASALTLRAVEDEAEQMEKELEKLEDLCEECELQEFILEKHFEKNAYKQMKINQLEHYRQKIASQHQVKIRTHEDRLRQLQKERQAVFEDAFRGDLEEYKQHGQLTKIETTTLPTKKLELEEVVLEPNDIESKDALEKFLNG
ncbi:dysbindin protein homolog [Scaptodrosophila lebanonensis]|uniref:Dysbindin protein homolog n=1 Tax=Drosophila lebanonensis TaxID=7225 RepID=A0A6J2UFQ5_DROLE|nr:dysbindin protein homolog [Scaptodrosophila lebanonensis]